MMRLLFALIVTACVVCAESPLQVPVWSDGGAISSDSVTAQVNGADSKVLAVRGPDDDLMLLVVLDLTDDLAAVTQARNALAARIEKLAGNHFVGIMAAQNGLTVLAAPGDDRESTNKALRSHPVGGRAGLLNTLEEAARISTSIENKSGVRVAVLYVSDSDINNYRENYNNAVVNSSDKGDLSRQVSDQLVRERVSRMTSSLAASRAPVFIAQLSYKNDQLNQAYQTGLLSLAGATGGSAVVSRSVAEIPSAIDDLMDRIVGHYSVGVEVPEGTRAQVDVKLALQSGAALSHRSNFVLAP
jgi:hypothetical protein